MALVNVLLAVSILNMELMQSKAMIFFFHCQHLEDCRRTRSYVDSTVMLL
jgi:hypothetical protein